MTSRLLRPFNIDVAHKSTHKLRSYSTKHKDKTTITETKNAMYMIPCGDCSQQHIGQTLKKIATRITEHKNAVKRHNLRSLPAAHTYDNCHTFNWTKTQLLGRAQTKYARELKRHGTAQMMILLTDTLTFLESTYNLRLRKNSVSNDTNITNTNIVSFPITLQYTSETHHSYNSNDTLIPNKNVQSSMTTHPSTTNDNTSTCKEPIRRSQRIRSLRQQRKT